METWRLLVDGTCRPFDGVCCGCPCPCSRPGFACTGHGHGQAQSCLLSQPLAGQFTTHGMCSATVGGPYAWFLSGRGDYCDGRDVTVCRTSRLTEKASITVPFRCDPFLFCLKMQKREGSAWRQERRGACVPIAKSRPECMILHHPYFVLQSICCREELLMPCGIPQFFVEYLTTEKARAIALPSTRFIHSTTTTAGLRSV